MSYVIYVYQPNKYCFIRCHTAISAHSLSAYIVDKALDAPMIIRAYAAHQVAPDRIQPWEVDPFVTSGLGFIDKPT